MKLWNILRSVCLCALGSWGAGLILCRVLGLAPAASLPLCFGGGLCGSLAFLCQNRGRVFSGMLLGLGLLCAAALGYMLGGLRPLLFSVAAGLLCFGAVTLGSCGFYGPLGVWSVVILSGSTLLAGAFGPGWQGASALGAAICLGLTLDGFRENSVRKGRLLHRDTPMGNAFGLTGNSRLLLGLFFLAAVAAALGIMGVFSLISGGLRQLGHFLLTGTGKLGYIVAMLLGKLITWLLSLLPNAPGESRSFSDSTDFKFDLEPYDGGSPGSTLLFVMLLVVGAVALVTVSGLLILRKKRHKKEAVPEICDYVDEIERLERPKWRSFSRWRRKTVKVSNYRGAMKIRFAFQQFLKKRLAEDSAARTKTPNELRREGHPDEDTLIDSYNRVRYGNRDVTEEELAAAERVCKK